MSLGKTNLSLNPSEVDNTEGTGQNKINLSLYGFQGSAKSASTVNADGSPVPPPKEAILFKTGTSWGENKPIATPETSTVKKEASPVKKAKEVKKDQSGGKLDPDHPSAVSQDMSKNILDATMAANPGALGHVLGKALQSMVMLKMMDKLTSPAGILSMASGGMGGALQGLAAGVGVSSMLGALNSVMPALSVSGILNGTGTDTLHSGMMGMIDNVAVGALAAGEVAAAVSSASTISEAMGAIASGAADALDAVAAFGGPAFGLQPGSLAAKIALVGPSGRVDTSVDVGGIRVNATIITSSVPQLTQNIPILKGTEHIAIATAAVSDITGTLSDALGVNNVIGQALGTVSDITGGVADLAGAFSNISSFTPSALGGVVNGGIAGVIDGGLTKILGFPMSGLMANASSLLPGIGGSITGALSSFSLPAFTLPSLPSLPTIPSIPGFTMPSLSDVLAPINDIGNITEGLTNATKAMSLSKAAHNVAQNIFGEARAESVANAVGSLANVVAAVGTPMTMITAFGDRVHCSLPTENLAKTAAIAAQNIIGSGLRV